MAGEQLAARGNWTRRVGRYQIGQEYDRHPTALEQGHSNPFADRHGTKNIVFGLLCFRIQVSIDSPLGTGLGTQETKGRVKSVTC